MWWGRAVEVNQINLLSLKQYETNKMATLLQIMWRGSPTVQNVYISAKHAYEFAKIKYKVCYTKENCLQK